MTRSNWTTKELHLPCPLCSFLILIYVLLSIFSIQHDTSKLWTTLSCLLYYICPFPFQYILEIQSAIQSCHLLLQRTLSFHRHFTLFLFLSPPCKSGLSFHRHFTLFLFLSPPCKSGLSFLLYMGFVNYPLHATWFSSYIPTLQFRFTTFQFFEHCLWAEKDFGQSVFM